MSDDSDHASGNIEHPALDAEQVRPAKPIVTFVYFVDGDMGQQQTTEAELAAVRAPSSASCAPPCPNGWTTAVLDVPDDRLLRYGAADDLDRGAT